MKVARIEIFGFKSFLDRLILPIQPGLTGVVGPNGCGKSNIVDALRWVLGETRASSLRGTSLEDVIFNGTEKLRPLGLAEVTLTLKASERDFFSDLLVSLGRTQEQVPELVLGAALDSGSALEVAAPDTQPAEHGTLVRSGRPNLRVISGALDPQHQPESSEPSLDESMPENELLESGATPELEAPPETAMLTRYAWLKSVEEVQITRRLYRSGESEFFINRVPCRLKDIKELFRVAGLGARAYTIVAQGEVSRIVTSRPEERRLIIEEAAGVTGFRDKIAAANRRLEETATNISRIEDVIKEVTR
ncbi:MAG: hypothetical protein DCC75_11050, partial [Proteobacteria bacterium]